MSDETDNPFFWFAFFTSLIIASIFVVSLYFSDFYGDFVTSLGYGDGNTSFEKFCLVFYVPSGLGFGIAGLSSFLLYKIRNRIKKYYVKG